MKFLYFSVLRTNLKAHVPILQHPQIEECICTVVTCAFREFSCFKLTSNYSFCCIHQLLTYTKLLVASITLQIFFICSCIAQDKKFLLYTLFCTYCLTCIKLYNSSEVRIYMCKMYAKLIALKNLLGKMLTCTPS